MLDACTFAEGSSYGECYVLSGTVEGEYFTVTGDTGESVCILFPAITSSGVTTVPAFTAEFTRYDAGGSLVYSGNDSSIATASFAYPLTLSTVVDSASGASTGNTNSLATYITGTGDTATVVTGAQIDDLFTGYITTSNTFSVN